MSLLAIIKVPLFSSIKSFKSDNPKPLGVPSSNCLVEFPLTNAHSTASLEVKSLFICDLICAGIPIPVSYTENANSFCLETNGHRYKHHYVLQNDLQGL